MRCFNTQPPEGGWFYVNNGKVTLIDVSTHSHPKVAGYMQQIDHREQQAFQHTATRRWLETLAGGASPWPMFQHTATRRWLAKFEVLFDILRNVSTHSHPKVAGASFLPNDSTSSVSTHSHPKVAGRCSKWLTISMLAFQHTATRRWLGWICR